MKTPWILISLLSFSSGQQVQASQTFPARLTCKALGDCIEGYSGFCEASNYFPVTIDTPSLYAAELYDPSETLSDAELQSKVKLDFSDGDQYSFYFFDAAEMSALAQGSLTKIQGTYEDGFDWTNGYNTRARFAIECVSDPLQMD